MPLAVNKDIRGVSIRVEGETSLGLAEELKAALLEALQSAGQVRVDVSENAEIGVPVLQLLWAAAREAPHGFTATGAAEAASAAGFDEFPGVSRGENSSDS